MGANILNYLHISAILVKNLFKRSFFVLLCKILVITNRGYIT